MRKTIGKVMLGIITAAMMAACQAAEFFRFEYESRGAPWEVGYHLTIDFDNRVLITQTTMRCEEYRQPDGYCPRQKTKKIISLRPEEITELQKMLNSAGVIRWKDKYENRRGVCDGTFWDASYVLKDGTSRKIKGDNNWPRGIKELSAALEKMGFLFIQ